MPLHPKKPPLHPRNAKSFLFIRESRVAVFGLTLRRHNVVVQVDALNKDHAIARLGQEYPYVKSGDWDFLEELDIDSHDVGKVGTRLYFTPPQ